ncbi:MAG: hypothetical protein IEMM0002_1346 [bacterium]|nr:MAG: hypothetical protein IEMM0002_1346 [bacterium]
MNYTKKIFSVIAVLSLLVVGWSGAFSPSIAKSQKGMKKPPDFQTMVPSKYGFNDTVDMLKAAIEGENLMVIKEINAQKMLRMVGVQAKGMKQILFFHPRFMKRIMKINKHATIEPPLKIAVMEKPNGKVMVKYIKQTYIFSRYEGMEKVGVELDSLLAKIVKSVQK